MDNETTKPIDAEEVVVADAPVEATEAEPEVEAEAEISANEEEAA